MTAETIIEGDVREDHALVPVPPQVMGLARTREPEEIVALATRMATALKDIVDRQKLYATISGKRFPTVEAWMTVARFDNVVAREVSVARQSDGSYEAWVELVRLSDDTVIGRASAICGMEDDRPWANRAEYARRSMAVTRATSRAFRQQYSWIMALAGYEVSPAEEMPRDEDDEPRRRSPRQEASRHVTLTGSVVIEQGDFEPRQYPQGWAILFHIAVEDEITRVIVTHADKEALPRFDDGATVRVDGEWQPKQGAVVASSASLVSEPTDDIDIMGGSDEEAGH